ncbi:MAG: hypothetical protein GX665_12420 [Gammaproteobacteria bacterium]|nr:hypothetical protein [Gammaproteobacteria bacterium]
MATVNPWKRFIELLPGGSRAVGEVMHIDVTAGTSMIKLRNGSEIMALGTGVSVGDMCFVLDGHVTGSAPSLPQFDIEV